MASWKKVVGVRKDPIGKLQIYKTSFSKREAQRRWRENNIKKNLTSKGTERIDKTTRYEFWTERRLLSLIRQGIIIPEYNEEKHNP